LNLGNELVERARIGIAESPRAARLSKCFNGLERVFALEPADDTTERSGEPSHIVVKCNVFAADRWPGEHIGAWIGAQANSRDWPILHRKE
jgi:hypothetical protein